MGNFYSVLFLTHSVSHWCYQLLTPKNLQSILTEGDCRRLPVTSHSISSPCQSEWLTSLGITRWQTVILLLSMLYITTMAKSFFFQSFSVLIILLNCGCYIHCGKHKSHRWPKQCKLSFSVMLNGECTKLNQSFNSLTEPDSF